MYVSFQSKAITYLPHTHCQKQKWTRLVFQECQDHFKCTNTERGKIHPPKNTLMKLLFAGEMVKQRLLYVKRKVLVVQMIVQRGRMNGFS